MRESLPGGQAPAQWSWVAAVTRELRVTQVGYEKAACGDLGARDGIASVSQQAALAFCGNRSGVVPSKLQLVREYLQDL